jgi:hypothetical protein
LFGREEKLTSLVHRHKDEQQLCPFRLLPVHPPLLSHFLLQQHLKPSLDRWANPLAWQTPRKAFKHPRFQQIHYKSSHSRRYSVQRTYTSYQPLYYYPYPRPPLHTVHTHNKTPVSSAIRIVPHSTVCTSTSLPGIHGSKNTVATLPLIYRPFRKDRSSENALLLYILSICSVGILLEDFCTVSTVQLYCTYDAY